MNGPTPTPDSRVGQLQARLAALQVAQAQARTALAKAEQAATIQRAGRRRPPRDLVRQLQRERDRCRTRLAAITTELQLGETELVALRERLAVVQAELAQLDQPQHPMRAGLTIAAYSERYFALRRELRDLVGDAAGASG